MAVLILSARLPATGPGLSFFGVSRCRRDILVVFTLSRCVLAENMLHQGTRRHRWRTLETQIEKFQSPHGRTRFPESAMG